MSDQEERLLEWGPGKTPKGRSRLPSSRHCDVTGSNPVAAVLSEASAYLALMPQDRIQQLESLVVDLMQQVSGNNSVQEPGVTPGCPSHAHATDSSPEAILNDEPPASIPAVSDHGSMQLTNSGTSYVSSAHWAAVLDGIAELKDRFEEEEEESQQARCRVSEPSYPDWTGPQLLYGCPKFVTKEEILASVPTRPVVDRLVSRYFNSFEMSPAVVHSVEFLKEYERFWEDPSSTPVIWLGLLFTMMCLATLFQKFRLEPSDRSATQSMEQDLQQMVQTFRLKIVQCLVLVELFLSNDAEIGVWILLGTVVQLAMHMGYHRDGKHFKGMSPFNAEMRRRVWATIVEVDLGISAQMGLPRLIKQWQTDTTEPSNLQDNDFNKATTHMPPSLPETNLTPMLYRLVKARVMATIGFIWDFAADTRTYTYAEIMKMDAKLQEAYTSIPECLKWHSIAHCITDSPQVIIQKVFLEIVCYRAKIVLHRKYLHCSPPNNQYGDTQSICLNAALKLLDYQHMLQEETQPFCQLYQERWRVSSIVNHDFLLATSVLCYYLKQTSGERPQGTESSINETIRASLRRSYDIWLHSSSSSKEAQKAVQALSVVLEGHNSSSVDSDVSINSSLGVPPPNFASSASRYGQDNPADFSVQFPVFDATVMSNWPTPANEPMGLSPVATSLSNPGWQIMDATDTISPLQWPWDCSDVQ
ncbi:Fc.00g025380.m01.CDS01 [Cosmosporella sp. VM-42]